MINENKVKYLPVVHFSTKEEYGLEIPSRKINSTYREDFKGAHTKRPDLIVQEPDYYDIIAGPFLDPLLPDARLAIQPDPSKWESCDSLYNKFTNKYPNLKKKVLPNEVDQSKVMSEYDTLDLTVYQVEFGKGSDSGAKFSPTTRRKLKLPDDWVIPLSTQRTSYRNLTDMKNCNLISFDTKTESFPPPQTELGFTREEQEVLQTTTGESEYQECYSNCGRDVMEHAFYGEIKPLPREFRNKNKETT